MTDMLVEPPIRTSLQDSATNGTAKEWYYFWRASSDQINANRIKLDGLVTSGTHAARPDPEDLPEGALYVETDRHVIYQNQGGNWQYIAGTMWGTLSPDQRPTDLGVHDGGFDFRGTDQAREFIWSQTVWVEATEAYYGTHAGRPASSAVADGVLYVETDRGNVIYQQQANAWQYVAGVMNGTLSPDQRPAGLGANDTGFLFQATDTLHLFRWSGSAWVDQTPPATPNNSALLAYTSGTLTLTTSDQNVPGCSLTLNRAGSWLVTGTFDMVSTNDAGVLLVGKLSGYSAIAIYVSAGTSGRATVQQQWLVTGVIGSFTAQLMASKGAGAGTSQSGSFTCISAIWISP